MKKDITQKIHVNPFDTLPNNLLGIKLIKEVADRYLQKKVVSKNIVNSSKELFNYLYYKMQNKDREIFFAIYLNAKNKILATEKLFEGSLTASMVYLREVVKAAIEKKAAALIFVHNHPSGDPEPSDEDIAITKRLIFACRIIGIAVHEHIIIGNKGYYSFSDNGHIARINREFNAKKQ